MPWSCLPPWLFAGTLHAGGATLDVAGAMAEYEALLADPRRVLGPDHPGNLPIRNLFYWRTRSYLRLPHSP